MDDDINSQDFQQTGTENFQKLIYFPEIFCHQQGHAGSKTFHQQNPPVLNWRCQITQVDLYNGGKTVVVVVIGQLMESGFDQYCMNLQLLILSNPLLLVVLRLLSYHHSFSLV